MVWLAFKMSMCLESKMYGFVILASLLVHTLTYIYNSDVLLTIPRLMLLTSSAVTLHIFVLHKKFCSSLRLDILFTIIPQVVVTKSSVLGAFCSYSFNENLTWNARSSSMVYLRWTSFCSTFLLIPNRFCDSFELHCWCPQDEIGSLTLWNCSDSNHLSDVHHCLRFYSFPWTIFRSSSSSHGDFYSATAKPSSISFFIQIYSSM